MSNTTDLWPSGVFFQALNTPKLVFGPGLRLDLAGGSLLRSPEPIVGFWQCNVV